jgi:hypothetical protein
MSIQRPFPLPRSVTAWTGLALLFMVLAADAHAQSRRPYRALFGTSAGETEQLLSLNVSFGGGYDDNVLADPQSGLGGVSDPRTPANSTYGGLSAGLQYSLGRSRVSFGASASGSVRYYPPLEPQFVDNYAGAVGMSARLTKRTSISVSESVSYQPYYVFNPFPVVFNPDLGAAPDVSVDFASSRETSINLISNVGLSHTLGARTSLSANYGYQRYDFSSAGTTDFDSQFASVTLSHGMTKNLSVRAGYGYGSSIYADGAGGQSRAQNHNIDAGVDYNRALSLSRRTTLAFSTGSSILVWQSETRYNITGSASLNREIGRTWNAGASYVRGVTYEASFQQPLMSDAFSVGVNGALNRRTQFVSSASYANGGLLLGNGGDYDTYIATAGLTFALSRYLGLQAGYFFYHYKFDENIIRPPGTPQELNRQGVHVNLSTWLPLYQRVRRPDAAR